MTKTLTEQSAFPTLATPAHEIEAVIARLMSEKRTRARKDAALRGEYPGFAPAWYLSRNDSSRSTVIPEAQIALMM